ncbi:MAG: DUF362 domain-containing protein [Proteobacteria bacterium]|nr:DUF362 domain-containing protein [Pseudomonadota bacterium]
MTSTSQKRESRKRGRKRRARNGDTEPDAEGLEALAAHRGQERRRFLQQAGAVAGLAAASGLAAFRLHDPDGERGKPRERTLSLPEGGYAVEASPRYPLLGVARGEQFEALVRGAVDAIGGIERFVARGDVVLVKPNVAFERAAPLGATTHPQVLSALVRLVLEAGAGEVRVADNPIEAPEACFARTGLRAAALESGARVYLPASADFRLLHTPGASLIERWPFFYRPFLGADKVIGVAPVKDHNLCRASMTTKNWYGLLGGRRNQFHQDIHTIIADLALLVRPTFVLLDGTRVLFRSGPTGGSLSDVKFGHTVVASTDSLAADAFGWDELLERSAEPLPAYFDKARERKLGNPDWRSLRLKEVQVG